MTRLHHRLTELCAGMRRVGDARPRASRARNPSRRVGAGAGQSGRRVRERIGWEPLGYRERVLHAGVVVAALSLVSMATVDRPIAVFMKQQVQGDILALWQVVTQMGVATGYVAGALLLLLVAWIGARVAAHETTAATLRRIQRYCVLLLAGLAVSGAVVNLAKIAIGRMRPRYLFENGVYGFEPFNLDTGANTFPSGHAHVIWTVAAVLCLAFPRFRLVFCTLAAMVALSRVILSVHYLGDVLMGSYIGLAAVLLLAPAILRRPSGTSG